MTYTREEAEAILEAARQGIREAGRLHPGGFDAMFAPQPKPQKPPKPLKPAVPRQPSSLALCLAGLRAQLAAASAANVNRGLADHAIRLAEMIALVDQLAEAPVNLRAIIADDMMNMAAAIEHDFTMAAFRKRDCLRLASMEVAGLLVASRRVRRAAKGKGRTTPHVWRFPAPLTSIETRRLGRQKD